MTKVKDQPYLCYSYVRVDGLAATLVTDNDYSARHAFTAIQEILAHFEKADPKAAWKEQAADSKSVDNDTLNADVTVWQSPAQADKLTKVQLQLDEIKDILEQSISQVLKNGETIDKLTKKSADLSEQTKIFVNNTKKLNPCCKAF